MTPFRTVDDPRPGDVVGAFRLEEAIGEGGMAHVFRARDGAGGTVALKLVKTRLLGDEIQVRRFVHEARSAAAVRHAHLLPILDAGEADGRLYLATRLVDGGTVEQRLDREGPLPIPSVIRLARDVGSALDALHAAGLVHRDVKASNLLCDDDGSTLLADLGLAKGEGYTALTQPGSVLGTLEYLAPELIRGEQATPASDVYALGCTVYQCLTGRTPFGDRSLLQLGLAHLEEDPPDPVLARADCPPELARAVVTALEKDPARRPLGGGAYAAALEAAYGVDSEGR